MYSSNLQWLIIYKHGLHREPRYSSEWARILAKDPIWIRESIDADKNGEVQGQ